MRVSRKVVVILVIAAFAIAFGFLFSNYLEARSELTQLQGRLSTAQTRIPGLITQKEGAENQEQQARSALDNARAKFPRSVESIEYDEGLFQTALESVGSRVQITRVSATSVSERSIGNISYSVAGFTVVIKGEIRDILEFVHALRTGKEFEFPFSAEVKQVEINYQGGEALIGLDIFGYKG